MSALVYGGAGEIPAVEVRTGCDEFENAIRKFGACAACEWFGYPADSEFTADTIDMLMERPDVDTIADQLRKELAEIEGGGK